VETKLRTKSGNAEVPFHGGESYKKKPKQRKKDTAGSQKILVAAGRTEQERVR